MHIDDPAEPLVLAKPVLGVGVEVDVGRGSSGENSRFGEVVADALQNFIVGQSGIVKAWGINQRNLTAHEVERV